MALLIVGLGLWMLASSWHGRAHEHTHAHAVADEHSHFGVRHTHRAERLFDQAARPSWMLLLGLGLAGGLLPDPAALAVLLAAIAGGELVLGLVTVLVFSLGFASVLVVVGTLVGRLGQSALSRIDMRWQDWLQLRASSAVEPWLPPMAIERLPTADHNSCAPLPARTTPVAAVSGSRAGLIYSTIWPVSRSLAIRPAMANSSRPRIGRFTPSPAQH